MTTADSETDPTRGPTAELELARQLPHDTAPGQRSSPRLSRWTRWSFGGGEWANALMWTAFSGLFLYFFTDVVGGNAAFGASLMLAGTVWNTVLQPYVGLRSDRSRSKYGRRRPFLLAAVGPYAVMSWLLFTDPGLSGAAQIAYFAIVILGWFSALATFYIPYGTLSAELTDDVTERTSLSTIRTGFSQIGALVGAVTPLALHGSLADLLGGSERVGWSATGALCAFLAAGGLLLTWRTTRGLERLSHQEAALHWKQAVAVLRSRTVRLMLLMTGFGWGPLSALAIAAVYFAVHIMGYSEETASLVMLCWFLAGLAWLPLVQRLTNRIGKKHTYLAFTITWAILQSLFLLAHRGTDIFFWALVLASAAGSMAVAVTTWSMLADICDLEQLRTGRRSEGVIFGLAAFAQTGVGALAVWVAGLTLSAVGYHGGDNPGGSARNAIAILMSVGTAIWLVPGILCALRYPLTTQRHAAIQRRLKDGTSNREELLRGI